LLHAGDRDFNGAWVYIEVTGLLVISSFGTWLRIKVLYNRGLLDHIRLTPFLYIDDPNLKQR
ncbi:MAG: hypothetical protein JWM11_7150, partial [Planctomycetaceae bacterium]|nr:hypothetical protein [Planctomycetaceae bacterium]